MLPESKYEFPKCIYLDQNKWIDLARAHYGLKEGVPFKEALESLSSAVATGKVLVPMSCIHVIETVGFSNSSSRRRLAQVKSLRDENFFLLNYFIYSILLTYGICQWHQNKRHFFRQW